MSLFIPLDVAALAVVTVLMFAAWRIWGARMAPQGGSQLPDFSGGLLEFGGYVIIGLLAIIMWLIWGLFQ